ncbi:DUF2087 domain-containing protein [Streptomyces sp. JNUCC 64]
MNDHTTVRTRGVEDLFSRGRLTTVPRRAARRDQLFDHLVERLFTPDRAYTEREVNDALRTVHDDCAGLRRDLVSTGRLTRTRDGAAYRVSDTP